MRGLAATRLILCRHQSVLISTQFLCSVQNVAFNLLFAGHDTSASALTLLLRYLKQEPEVLEKLREEQRQVELYTHFN